MSTKRVLCFFCGKDHHCGKPLTAEDFVKPHKCIPCHERSIYDTTAQPGDKQHAKSRQESKKSGSAVAKGSGPHPGTQGQKKREDGTGVGDDDKPVEDVGDGDMASEDQENGNGVTLEPEEVLKSTTADSEREDSVAGAEEKDSIFVKRTEEGSDAEADLGAAAGGNS